MRHKIPLWRKAMFLFAWAVLLGGLVGLVMNKPSITGFTFSSQTNVQVIDFEIQQNEEFVITADNPAELLKLQSFRVWGTVYNKGLVKVLLANTRGEQLLVYSNQQLPGLAQITGLTTSIVQPHEITHNLMIQPTKSGTVVKMEGEATAIVEGACIDTCVIPKNFRDDTYKIIVEVDDQTAFRLQRVSYEI